MLIVHNVLIGDVGNDDLIEALRLNGIEPSEKSGMWFVIEMAEDNPKLPALLDVARRYRAPLSYGSRFSSDELNGAKFLWLRVPLSGRRYYPEPKAMFITKQITYDKSGACPQCGLGERQVAPFRLKAKPRWRKGEEVTQLYWVEDEFFARPEFWESTLRPLGIKSRPVVYHKTGEPIENIVQLDIQDVVELDMNDPRLLGISTNTCPVCNQTRYNDIVRSFFPRPIDPKGHLFKSAQWFGEYRESYREIFVSQELYRILNRSKNIIFKPCLRAEGA